jgi:hypothetical protein
VVVLFVCAFLGLQVLLLQKLVDAATMPCLAESLASKMRRHGAIKHAKAKLAQIHRKALWLFSRGSLASRASGSAG